MADAVHGLGDTAAEVVRAPPPPPGPPNSSKVASLPSSRSRLTQRHGAPKLACLMIVLAESSQLCAAIRASSLQEMPS